MASLDPKALVFKFKGPYWWALGLGCFLWALFILGIWLFNGGRYGEP
jgi:hypothetical protein